MSLLVDLKFVSSISHLLRNFKKKADYLWNFSCPICGDSKKNKLKARAYILRSQKNRDRLAFKCHNCGESFYFDELLKRLDESVYKEYVYDSYLERTDGKAQQTEKKEKPPAPTPFPKKTYRPLKPTALIGCPSIASLPPEHPAKTYLLERKIPEPFLKQLYWTDDFPSVVDKVCPGHQFALKKEGRIVIPFLDANFGLIGMQGRALDKNSIRYITVKAFEEAPRIYGLHRLGNTLNKKRIYIVEGPFDSLFLPRCLAVAGSDIPTGLPIDQCLIVYDNEPRKPETCDKIAKAIQRGYRVCIWPDTIKEKDLNDMVLSGYKPDKLRDLIDKHSYAGLEATVRLQHWRKY
jgi:transcription elongation factor Elf1